MRIALIVAGLISTVLTAKAEIPWNSDLKVAHQQAEAEGKLLLVHFESDNCVWCDRLEAGAFQSPEVATTISQAYIPVKINASKNKKLAEYFKVSRFPTDVVVDASGAVHAHSVSPQVPGQYIAMLHEAAAKSGHAMKAIAENVAQQTPQEPVPGPPTSTGPSASSPNQTDPPSLAVPGTPVASAQPQQTVDSGNAGYALPPSASASIAQDSTNGQFQLPSHTASQPASAVPASAGIQMPPSARIQNNDGGATSIAQNMLATQASATVPAGIEPGDELSQGTFETAVPPLAIDGFCAVAILDETRWVSGNKKFGAIHLGKLYLFSSAEAQTKFLADPEKYTPALGGMDVVRFIEGQEQIDGSREFGLHHQGRLYFFSNEDSLKRFFQSPEAYTVKAQDIMRQATNQIRGLH